MSKVKPLGTNRLEDYITIIGDQEYNEIKELGDKLKGKEITHVNATAFGGGVAEILHRLIPLMECVGLKCKWQVIEGDTDFFTITKTKFHNGLQGKDVTLSEAEKRVYIENNKRNAEKLDFNFDFVVIHDPQPLAIIDFAKKTSVSRWIWRCHIDVSTPNSSIWDFVAKYVNAYDATIFSMKEYIKDDLKTKKVAIIPPSIDPLSDKNKLLSETEIVNILEKYDIDPEKPIISQVGRFDPWKDPLGVIDTYRIVKRKIPDVQLLLITAMATDDPEAWYWFEKTARYAGDDYDIHLLTNLIGVGNLEVNAFQSASNVGILKSIREGFGLVVSESLWKKVPVVGSRVGGIKLQIIDGKTGYLVDNVKDAAEKIIYLLRHPEIAKKMGIAGHDYVKRHFLITRHLKDYLILFNELLA